MCIDKIQVCDDKIDCKFKEDETNCCKYKKTRFQQIHIIYINKFQKNFIYKSFPIILVGLSNGKTIILEANNRPDFKTNGIFTQNQNGIWKVVCAHKTHFDENPIKYTEKFCSLLGFKGYYFYNKTLPLKKSIIPAITDEFSFQPRSSILNKHLMNFFEFLEKDDNLNDNNYKNYINENLINYKTEEYVEFDNDCEGIYIECIPHFIVNEPLQITHKFIIPEIKPKINPNEKPNVFFEMTNIMHENLVKSYHWPWLSQIFIDGNFKCIGVLLDKNWIAVKNECIKGIRR